MYLTFFNIISEDLQSTDSEDEPDFSKMTEKEQEKYLKEKATRKAQRENKRKEKYGDKYEEMAEKHQKLVYIYIYSNYIYIINISFIKP